MMDYEQLAEQIIKEDEDYREKAYKDHLGNLTIGYGTNLNYLEIDESLALRWMRRDIVSAEFAAREFVGDSVFETLSKNRKVVLISMAYQMGRNGLFSFRRFRDAILEGDWREAGNEMLNSRWAKQTPARAGRLTDMFVEG